MPTTQTHRVFLALAILFLLGWVGSHAANAQTQTQPKVRAELVSNTRSVVPGQPLFVALHQRIETDWHTYWRNPGDSGLPTRITWVLPEGFRAGDISWPVPEAIPYGPLTNYGYSNEVYLPVEILTPPNIDTRTVTLRAKAQWLVCKDICIPESADLELTMPVAPAGSESLPTPHAKTLDALRRALPIDSPWDVSALASKDKLAIRFDAPSFNPDRIQKIEFFPFDAGYVNHAGGQRVTWADAGPQLLADRPEKDILDGPMTQVEGLLVITETVNGKTVRNGFNLTAPVTSATAEELAYGEPAPRAIGNEHDPAPGLGFITALLFAFVGGLILNLMPCVLPILSLKVLSLAKHSDTATASGLWYLAGVVTSFTVLAGVLITLQSTGAAMGWGFQFQSPTFVLAMAALFFLMGLSMSGVYNIGVGLEGTGEALTRDIGPRGSFFTGALATLAATPCTAPFMGVAIGYAMSRSPLELFLVLQALGLGFALPMVALSISNAATRLLPKPGAWMDTLKQVLAFPLYATTAWLVWVLSRQLGSDGVLSAAILLTSLGFAGWVIGRPGFSIWLRTAIALLVVLPALAWGLPLIEMPNQEPAIGRSAPATKTKAENAFTRERLDALRAQGRPVFVNITAAWCITCKVNERIALHATRVTQAMSDKNVAQLVGDWTLQDAEITSVLKSFGRSGVPLYLLYPADVSQKPKVLPQLLTESIVLGYVNDLP